MHADSVSVAHEALHDGHVTHHHEEDGSIHFDTSDESIQHVQEHSCATQPGSVFVPARAPSPIELVETISSGDISFDTGPTLESPQRPPAFALG